MKSYFMRYVVGKKNALEMAEEDLDSLEMFLSLCGHLHYPHMASGYKEVGYHRMIQKTYRHLTRRYGLLYLMNYMPYLRLFNLHELGPNEAFLRALWNDIRHIEKIRDFFPFHIIAPQINYFCCLLITSDDERLYFDLNSSAYAEELITIFETVCASHLPWMKDLVLYENARVYYRASRKHALPKIIQFYQWFTALTPEEQNVYMLESVHHPLFQPVDIGQISEITECEIF